MVSVSWRVALGASFVLRLVIASPVLVAIAPHGRTLPVHKGASVLRREKAVDTSAVGAGARHGHVENSGVAGDNCPAPGLGGEQLRRARAVWSVRHPKPLATLKIPVDNATITYAVRGGNLYRKGKVRQHKSEPGGFADDNVFIEALLWRTLRRFPHVQDADLVLSYGDVETRQSTTINAPVFTFSALRAQPPDTKVGIQESMPAAIGFPSPYIMDQALTLNEKLALRGGRRVRDVPWSQKRSLAFWRGTLTGANNLTEGVANKEGTFEGRMLAKEGLTLAAKEGRVRLAEIAKGRPHDLDIAFTDIDLKEGWSEPVKQDMLRTYKNSPHAGVMDFFDVLPEFKYLVNVDGVSVSWRGLPLMASGGLMLLQASDRGEFFSEDIQPWVHYVPLKRDLSNLLETLGYLREHDDMASRIAKAGEEFAYQNLTLLGLECYVYEALKFMSNVVAPLPLAELRASFGFVAVPEPDEHLQTSTTTESH